MATHINYLLKTSIIITILWSFVVVLLDTNIKKFSVSTKIACNLWLTETSSIIDGAFK